MGLGGSEDEGMSSSKKESWDILEDDILFLNKRVVWEMGSVLIFFLFRYPTKPN